MKTRFATTLLLGLWTSLLLCILSGCSSLPSLFPDRPEDASPTALELSLGSALPEDIVLTWNPAAVTVDSTEVSVTESSPDLPRTITVTIRLGRP